MSALCLASLCLLPMTDAGLCDSFDWAATPAVRSHCLAEMTRRGGPTFERLLARKLAEAARPAADRWQPSTVELLTALRRVQGKPEPLPVEVGGSGAEEAIFPNLPVIRAAIVNRDHLQTPVTFQDGGDYRSGRPARWRFDVRDAAGRAMAVKLLRSTAGGGITRTGVLKAGESWDIALAMRSFIDLPPGDYTVAVQYHDELTISTHRDPANVVVCRSRPFKLHVQPRVIDVTTADRAAAAAAVAALGDAKRVKILTGSYGPADHDFIPPDSAAGRLLALGWPAVPTLLDALADDKLTLQRRAWVFAVLFGITNWNDPRDVHGLFAGYDSRGGGWFVGGGKNGDVTAMGFGDGSRESMGGGSFDAAAQQAFAKKWRADRDFVVVREKP